MSMREHTNDKPLYLSEETHGALLDLVEQADLEVHPQNLNPREALLGDILTELGIAPPPPAADRAKCPSLFCEERGVWLQCQRAPGHSTRDDHRAEVPVHPVAYVLMWPQGHPRSMTAKQFADNPPREYPYCGADLGRDEFPFTCHRRVAHEGACGPEPDED